MPFRPQIAVALTALVAFLMAATANANTQSARNLLLLMGFDTYLESTAAGFKGAQNPLGSDDATLNQAWNDAADQAFNPDGMLSDVANGIATHLSADDIAVLETYYSSGLGERVTMLEIEAQEPANAALADAEGREILAQLIKDDDPRLKAYQEISDALGAIDTGAATAMNLNLALMNGMVLSGKLPYELSEEEILAIVIGQEEAIRSAIQQQLFVSFAYTYQSLSQDELAEYRDFLLSKRGRLLYLRLNQATETVLQDRATAFGRRFMELQSAQSL